MPDISVVLKKPFTEQVAFFRAKLGNLVPTQAWDDLWKSEHDRAFMVAGAMKADLLADLAGAVEKSINEGRSIGWFRENFDSIAEKYGWSYRGERNWRTRVIYQTNLSTSYAAGREAQIAAYGFPFKMYKHNDSVLHPRPLHQSWDGLTLPVDHPFWTTHSAPNGWGCKCRIVGIRDHAAAKRLGGRWGDEPPEGWDKIDPKTGEPVGIDNGWGYQPGASSDLVRQIKGKVDTLPPALGDALADDVAILSKKREFVPQKNAKLAAKWAMENDLVDFADYKGIKPEVANAWNQSLFEHINDFPELRKNQRFSGSIQAQYARWHQIQSERYIEKLVSKGVSETDAAYWANKHLKKPRTDNRWGQSWNQPEVSGIAVNEKWGKDVAAFNESLLRGVKTSYHPLGGDSIKSVADHELGHQLDALLSLSNDGDVVAVYDELVRNKGVKDAVSGYAAKNIAEFIAESWAEFRNNPEPRAIASRIGRLVEDRYRSKFPA